MTYPPQSANIKVCPECGTNLIATAKHCAACGYRFTPDAGPKPVKGARGPQEPRRLIPDLISLPFLFGLLILLLAVGGLLMYSLKAVDQRKTLFAAEQGTATYIATTYISPTPAPTATFTPAVPTETPVVDIEYEVVSGNSCLSISRRFNLYIDSLLRKNDIDCANLQIGTVLSIPQPTPTPEPIGTPGGVAAP